MRDDLMPQHLAPVPRAAEQTNAAPRIIHNFRFGANQVYFRVGECRHEFRDRITRGKDIIGPDKANELTLRKTDSLVPSVVDPAIGFADPLTDDVLIFPYQFDSAIRRATVDDNPLDI